MHSGYDYESLVCHNSAFFLAHLRGKKIGNASYKVRLEIYICNCEEKGTIARFWNYFIGEVGIIFYSVVEIKNRISRYKFTIARRKIRIYFPSELQVRIVRYKINKYIYIYKVSLSYNLDVFSSELQEL